MINDHVITQSNQSIEYICTFGLNGKQNENALNWGRTPYFQHNINMEVSQCCRVNKKNCYIPLKSVLFLTHNTVLFDIFRNSDLYDKPTTLPKPFRYAYFAWECFYFLILKSQHNRRFRSCKMQCSKNIFDTLTYFKTLIRLIFHCWVNVCFLKF